LPVPILVTVTGEGGSGGELSIAIGDECEYSRKSLLFGDLAGRLRGHYVA